MAKKKRKRGTELTPAELEYLCRGDTVDGEFFGDMEPFESEQQAAAAWRNHAAAVWEAFHAEYKDDEDDEPWAARVFKRAAG